MIHDIGTGLAHSVLILPRVRRAFHAEFRSGGVEGNNAVNPFIGLMVDDRRGWLAVDVKLRGKTYRFVTAHLDHPPYRDAQAIELFQGVDTDMPIILSGDFNTNPDSNDLTERGAYDILRGAGFDDAWQLAHSGEPGFTKQLFPDTFPVDPFTFTAPTERGDFVLFRGRIEVLASDVVGEENITPARPMPSNHAGVVATFRLLP